MRKVWLPAKAWQGVGRKCVPRRKSLTGQAIQARVRRSTTSQEHRRPASVGQEPAYNKTTRLDQPSVARP
jgi:hypothetical protein